MLSSSYLKRYKEIARLLWKYGRGDLIRPLQATRSLQLDPPPRSSNGATPDQLADDLEAMGPTYVKLGQILSGRPDLLPDSFVRALCRLQDRVSPFSFQEVEATVLAELGVRVSKAFSSFHTQPIAAASLGQVHLASLRDGRPVAVKIQRPDIGKQIRGDFRVLHQIATLLDAHSKTGKRYRFSSILTDFQTTIEAELDYQREARNLRTLRDNLKDFPLIHVPQPVNDYCTSRVLTMERVHGNKLTSTSPVVMLEMQGSALAEELFRAYLKQVLVDGFFHADPHPGNVFLTDDGRLALLDLGMVGYTTPQMQEHLLKILLATVEGKAEDAADLVASISEQSDEFDQPAFNRRIERLLVSRQGQPLEELNIGRSLLEVSRSAGDTGLFVPSQLSLLGKTLMQLDEIGRALDPQFDPNASIKRNVSTLVSQRMLKTASQGNLFTSLLETKSLMLALPSRLGRILDAVANAELEVRVKSPDARIVVEGIEKIANRITVGLILAALIVGAALLMRVDTSFRLFGYPGFAMVCFVVAGVGGGWLVLSTLLRDHESKKKREKSSR